jgi:hypothetical protein
MVARSLRAFSLRLRSLVSTLKLPDPHVFAPLADVCEFVSLAAVDFPDYDANDLPPALAKLPATKPGSRGLK